MTDGTTLEAPTEPRCPAVTDNGNGIVFSCVREPHPETPDQHFMKRDEASRG